MSSSISTTGSSLPFSETDNPVKLLRLFSVLSALSIVAILVLAGTGIYRVFSYEMIRVAEQWAIYVGNTIFEQERAVFLKGGSAAVSVASSDFDRLDARMKKFLTTFNMYKIKAFSADKTIVYSTDHSIIGKVEADNHKLEHVLATGAVVSALEHKEKVRDLKGEERFRLDVVECYVPIRTDGAIVGSFEVYVDITSTRARIVSAVQGALLVLAAVLVAIFSLLYVPMRRGTERLGKAEEKLAELASIDGLTGTFNRRFLLSRVHEEHARMLRAKAETAPGRMSFVMVDIDFFKKVNDAYGHLAGDAVLQEVSRRLKESLRTYDVLGRYGGEEFLVMLPNTDRKEALFVANRLHQAIRREPIACGGWTVPVTVSVGVAVTITPDEEVAHAISRADESLYRAKESGRDRVCIASDTEAVGSEHAPSSLTPAEPATS